MFRGSVPAKIDDKGRLKVPTDFRKLLEERFGPDLFVTSVHGDCAHLYPLAVWEEIEQRLARMPATNPSRQRFLRWVNYYGQQARMDNQGRLLLPQILRESAEMNGDVVISGQLDHLVVWNRERIERRRQEDPVTDEDLLILTEHEI